MSNEQRAELIQIIWDDAVADRVREGKDLRNVPVVRPKVEAMADAILEGGWRKPRTITTVEELDALGFRATVLDGVGEVWTNDGDGLDQWGSVTHKESYGGPMWVGSADIALPATVLHEAVTA